MDYGIPADESVNTTAATEQTQPETKQVDPAEVEAKINEALKVLSEVEDKEEQKKALEQFDPTIVYAARAEKRRRDTQAAYTKAQQEKLALQKEKEALENLIAQELEKSLDLSPEQQEELEELKLIDPDEWRRKLNELEKEQKTMKKSKIKELQDQARQEALQEAEVLRRQQILEEWQAKHPDVEITDEVIANEVPPKYIKDLEEGKISFEDFLDKVYNFLTANKVIPQEKAPNKPDLSKVSGGATPSENAKAEDIVAQYMQTTF